MYLGVKSLGKTCFLSYTMRSGGVSLGRIGRGQKLLILANYKRRFV